MLFVDQSAACIMMSAGLARALGIPDEQLVYLHGCGDAYESQTTLYRQSLHRSEAARLAGDRAMAQAGITPEQIDLVPSPAVQCNCIILPNDRTFTHTLNVELLHTYCMTQVDLYTCFPIAAQVVSLCLSVSLCVSMYCIFTGGTGRGAGVWAQLNGWQENDPDWRSDVPVRSICIESLSVPLCVPVCVPVSLCVALAGAGTTEGLVRTLRCIRWPQWCQSCAVRQVPTVRLSICVVLERPAFSGVCTAAKHQLLVAIWEQ